MSRSFKRWMMFVDGENLTLRAQCLAAETGVDLSNSTDFSMYKRDVCFWPSKIAPYCVPLFDRVQPEPSAVRCNYYTSTPGDQDEIDAVSDMLQKWGFNPVVMHKPKNKKSKGVDIHLTKDMLVGAFLDSYDVAVLVAGDGDFVPLVEEVKRLGKRVVVAFFEKNGLNPKLRRAADEFRQLQLRY